MHLLQNANQAGHQVLERLRIPCRNLLHCTERGAHDGDILQALKESHKPEKEQVRLSSKLTGVVAALGQANTYSQQAYQLLAFQPPEMNSQRRAENGR